MPKTFQIQVGNTSFSAQENELVFCLIDRILKSNPRYEIVEIHLNEKALAFDDTLHSDNNYVIKIYTTVLYKMQTKIIPHRIEYFWTIRKAQQFLSTQLSQNNQTISPNDIILLTQNNTIVKNDSLLGDSLIFNFFIKTLIPLKFIISDDKTTFSEDFSSDIKFCEIRSYLQTKFPQITHIEIGFTPKKLPIPESWMDDPYFVHRNIISENTLYISEMAHPITLNFIDESGNSIQHQFPSDTLTFREIDDFILSSTELFPNISNLYLEYENPDNERNQLPQNWKNDPYFLHKHEIKNETLFIAQPGQYIIIKYISPTTMISHEFPLHTLFRSIYEFIFENKPLKDLAYQKDGELVIIPAEWSNDPYSIHQNDIFDNTLYDVSETNSYSDDDIKPEHFLHIMITQNQIPSSINNKNELEQWLRSFIDLNNDLQLGHIGPIILLKLPLDDVYREGIFTFRDTTTLNIIVELLKKNKIKMKILSDKGKEQITAENSETWEKFKITNNILATNLPKGITEEILRTIFAEWGTLIQITIKSAKETGASIVYSSKEDATEAIRQSVFITFKQPPSKRSKQLCVNRYLKNVTVPASLKEEIQEAKQYVNQNEDNQVFKARVAQMSDYQILALYQDNDLLNQFIKSTLDEDDNSIYVQSPTLNSIAITFIYNETTYSKSFPPDTLIKTIQAYPFEKDKLKNYALAYNGRNGETVIIPREWVNDPYSNHWNEIRDRLYVLSIEKRFPPNQSFYLEGDLLRQFQNLLKKEFNKKKIQVNKVNFSGSHAFIHFPDSKMLDQALDLKTITLKRKPFQIGQVMQSKGTNRSSPSAVVYNCQDILVDQVKNSFKEHNLDVVDMYIDSFKNRIFIKFSSQKQYEEAQRMGTIKIGLCLMSVNVNNPYKSKTTRASKIQSDNNEYGNDYNDSGSDIDGDENAIQFSSGKHHHKAPQKPIMKTGWRGRSIIIHNQSQTKAAPTLSQKSSSNSTPNSWPLVPNRVSADDDYDDNDDDFDDIDKNGIKSSSGAHHHQAQQKPIIKFIPGGKPIIIPNQSQTKAAPTLSQKSSSDSIPNSWPLVSNRVSADGNFSDDDYDDNDDEFDDDDENVIRRREK